MALNAPLENDAGKRVAYSQKAYLESRNHRRGDVASLRTGVGLGPEVAEQEFVFQLHAGEELSSTSEVLFPETLATILARIDQSDPSAH